MTAHPLGKRYKGKKVLVTGGTGFIGCRLAERLVLEEGADDERGGRHPQRLACGPAAVGVADRKAAEVDADRNPEHLLRGPRP